MQIIKKDSGAILILLLTTILYFAPVIFFPEYLPVTGYLPVLQSAAFFCCREYKSGKIPLWNPYLDCGKPFQANVQSCGFYPGNSIYYFLPFQTGYKYFIVLHYFLGSLFIFLLMGEWRYGTYAAIVSAQIRHDSWSCLITIIPAEEPM